MTTPQPGTPLADDQVAVVLRWLRYSDDPPLSYRQAQSIFRTLGFICAEDRLRPAWSALVTAEADTDTAR